MAISSMTGVTVESGQEVVSPMKREHRGKNERDDDNICEENDGAKIEALDEVYRLPWKYIGYKDFTSFVASDPDFFAVRRFDYLHTRVLLTLQAQLLGLEKQLDSLDKHYAAKNTRIHDNGVVDITQCEEDTLPEGLRHANNGTVLDDLPIRSELISKIQKVLSTYDKTLADYAVMQTIPPAPQRNIQNLKSWFEQNPGAIVDDEADFMNQSEELISLSKPKTRLRELFEDYVIYTTRKKMRLFHRPPSERSRLSVRDREATYTTSQEALAIFGSVSVFAAATAMLIVPLWVLQTIDSIRAKLAVITVFVLSCLVLLSFAMLGRPLERLVATAGYAAVLVVFLQTDK